MTAIACRDGVLAADTGLFAGETLVGTCRKIVRLKDGSLFAGSGERQIVVAVERWLDNEMQGDKPTSDAEKFGGLWLRPSGIWMIHNRCEPHPLETDYAAEGGHIEFCLGAMAAGKSASEAVELAVRHCAFARGPVQVERL